MASRIDTETLISQLTEIVGYKQLLTGRDAARYGKDRTGKYSAQPLAVVRPACTKEVSQILRLANDTATPVVPVAGNTGLVGGTHAPDAVMLSVERMNSIQDIRPDARIAIVQAGVVLSQLHAAVDDLGLSFPLFFGARGTAMIGGVLSTNAGGSNVLRYGNVRALCLGLEIVLPDGEVMNLMSELHKDNSGYDLKHLFIGAEGTLGIITAAVLKLVGKPRAYATAMVAAASLADALKLLNRLQEATGGMVEAFEFMPRTYLKRLAEVRPDLIPPLGSDQDCTILLELGATAPRDATPADDGNIPVNELLETALIEMVEGGLVTNAVVARSDAQRQNMWEIREVAAEITMGRSPRIDTDVAVALDKVSTFLDSALAGLAEIDPDAETITVSHLGDGNVHFSVWPTSDDQDLMDSILTMIEDVTVSLGGSFSAEHGIGLSKLGSMRRHKDPVALAVMARIKRALDPKGIMNPGKVVP